MLYQGSDVWLNTPRRPMEASGTSGEKAALNGALNCSILDGWWDEMFDGSNGWAISSAEAITDLDHRDEVEANSLFELLERQIVPLFYDRRRRPLPRRLGEPGQGVAALARTPGDGLPDGPRLPRATCTSRSPPRATPWPADGYARARALTAWKQRVTAAWPEVKVEVDPEPIGRHGRPRRGREVTAEVHLGSLTTDDVAVELLHGPVVAGDELAEPRWCAWSGPARGRRAGAGAAGRRPRRLGPGRAWCATGASSVRPAPAATATRCGSCRPTPDLVVPVEMGCVAWA